MKALWTILSVLAVANLIALASFVGWLKGSDRLNLERVREVRAMLSKTVSQEQAESDAKTKADEAEKAKAEAERVSSRPPLTAAEKLSARMEATELDRQRIERLKREINDLQQQLALERQRLSAERQAFAEEKKQFEESIASTAAASTDAQFQKTLKVLSSQKPKEAVSLLLEMLRDPSTAAPELAPVPLANGAAPATPAATPATNEKGMSTVVGYLDAMNDKTRSKIIETLTKTDPKLAAELLERLRQRGEFARVP